MAEADIRTCSICIEQFKEPKLLPCFHTFCLHCLQHHVATYVQDGTFNCPVCRYEVTVPEGGVSAFQTNFYIEAEADRQAYTPRQKCDVCSNTADRKCLECSQFLCKSCITIHNSLGSSRLHTTITLGEVEEDSAVISRPQFCVKHKGEVIRFYCQPCEKSICRDCKLTSHEGHKTEDLCDLVAGAKLSLEKTKSDMERCIETMDIKLSKIDVRNQSLENTLEKTRAKINMSADELISLINEYRTKEIEKINAVGQVEEKCLENKKSEVSLIKRCLQAQIGHVDMVLTNGLDADVMATATEIPKVLEDVEKTKEVRLTSAQVLKYSFIENMSMKHSVSIFPNTKVTRISIVVTSEATKLKKRWASSCKNQKIDVIGPLSNNNSAWIGCTCNESHASAVLLVDKTGHISKRINMQKEQYRESRMNGLESCLPVEPPSCERKDTFEKCDSEHKLSKKSKRKSLRVPSSNVPPSDSSEATPTIYTFCGKQTPLFDKKANGDICRIDVSDRSVEVSLDNGTEMRFSLEAVSENMNNFSPCDVCWGLKDDIFIADSGLNVIHRYELSEGLKECYVTGHPHFEPSAIALDTKGRLWIGETNGTISLCRVY